MADKLCIIGGKAGRKIVEEICTFFLHIDCEYENADTYGFFIQNCLEDNYYDYYFVGIGDNKRRKKITEDIIKETNKIPRNIIHPNSYCAPSLFKNLGFGNFILPGTVIHTDVKIGNGCIINTNAVIEHDNIIGNYSQIGPGAVLAGYVTVGDYTNIWSNATVIPHIKIGNNVTVAAGAVVIKDIPDNCMVAGVPAEIKYFIDEKGNKKVPFKEEMEEHRKRCGWDVYCGNKDIFIGKNLLKIDKTMDYAKISKDNFE